MKAKVTSVVEGPAVAGHQGVTFAEVDKEFRNRRGKSALVLHRVSFVVRSKEFVSIVGPSGCGKTTLLRMAAGLEVPTRGHVVIDGTDAGVSHPDVGIMFQAPVLLPWRSVINNVLLPVDLVGHRGAEAVGKARDMLAMVGLAEFAEHYPRELSGGMQQRVSLARALLSDSRVLLLDEPFGALDALTREELNLELMQIWDQRMKTALLVTHTISEAVFLSDRVVVMGTNPGSVIEVIDIPLSRPRVPEMQYSPAFVELSRYITGRLPRRGRTT